MNLPSGNCQSSRLKQTFFPIGNHGGASEKRGLFERQRSLFPRSFDLNCPNKRMKEVLLFRVGPGRSTPSKSYCSD